jgi:hypothetical protein
MLLASLIASTAFAETLSPEADARKASGLLALKQKYPQVKDVLIDLDSAKIIKAGTGPNQNRRHWRRLCRAPQTRACMIGDKGKVLLTLFSDSDPSSKRSRNPAIALAFLQQDPVRARDAKL